MRVVEQGVRAHGEFLIPNIQDVVTGLTVDAIAAFGRQLSIALTGSSGRRRRADLEVATYFNSYKIVDRAFPEIPEGVDQARLIAELRGNEIQAIVQELLAVRLSDAPEITAQHLREAFVVSCTSSYAGTIFDEIDACIADLVVEISTSKPQIAKQIRQEAYFTRINATLEAITRHLAAAASPRDLEEEQRFLAHYRTQVLSHHGSIEPPDFQRRRRVPIPDLYVRPRLVEAGTTLAQRFAHEVDIFDDKNIDRTVILGSPGAGKTTVSNVLLYLHAQTDKLRVPFLVTLRYFAANDPPQWSVVEYIEMRLRTFYQREAPPGLVDRLLLCGNALVVFDGLDELIDTSRRIDVSAIIERFATEYPQAKILITSRLVGYDEARLDEHQFATLTIEGFTESQVEAYVRRWFRQETAISVENADHMATTLLEESGDITDLRSNPLMLALICILYRGEGSIPQSRSAVYEKCADLLFHKWDERRKIYVELRARHLIEPVLKYLAYWMLTRDDARDAVTRSELISETASYFQTRGFDEIYDATEAAEEFVDFCRDRAWVFSEVGTTSTGEQLYTFTHRTFLEYFAAYYLSSINESAERLAAALAPQVSKGEWDMVGQLAVQIKDRNTERGGERIFATLMADRRRRTAEHRMRILGFLARCVAAVQPRSSVVRDLARELMANSDWEYFGEGSEIGPIWALLEGAGDYAEVVAGEVRASIAQMIEGTDIGMAVAGLEIACCLPKALHTSNSSVTRFWGDFAQANAQTYSARVKAAAKLDVPLLWAAYDHALISAKDVVRISRKDLADLFSICWFRSFGFGHTSPINYFLASVLSGQDPGWDIMAALGCRWMALKSPPVLKNPDIADPQQLLFSDHAFGISDTRPDVASARLAESPDAYLGLLFSLALFLEDACRPSYEPDRASIDALMARLEPVPELIPYFSARMGLNQNSPLRQLAIGERHQKFLNEWAHGDIDFIKRERSKKAALQR
jgi:NACHT domain